MIGEYNKSVILTYIGVIFALGGMYFALNQVAYLAFLCLIAAGVCDLFDGAIARRVSRTERAKKFGVQLDSLADTVSFLALPTVIGFFILREVGFLCILYVLAGVIRLAWFNISENEGENVQHFQGLPVTYSALILPVYYLLTLCFPGVFTSVGFAVLYVIMAVAFVLNVKIKKPRGIMYVFFALLAVATSVGIVLLGAGQPNMF